MKIRSKTETVREERLTLTETEIRQAFAGTFISYLGTVEGSEKHLELIARYNANPRLPRGYRMRAGDSWCAAAPSAVALQLRLEDYIYPECSCPEMIRLYQNRGRWQEADGCLPRTGDLVMYDWEDDGVGDNQGGADHVGVVVEAAPDRMLIVEGNRGHRVGLRELRPDARSIRGFCCPDFAAAAEEGRPFADVPAGTWYSDAVCWAKENRIASGVGADVFGPDRFCTRAQTVMMLWRTAGSPEPRTELPPFADVRREDYYADAVCWAAEEKISSGVGGGRFAPHAVCTRAETAAMLYALAGSPVQELDGHPFGGGNPGDWYFMAMLWAGRNGILSGVGGGDPAPEKPATRAMTAVMLYRYAQM